MAVEWVFFDVGNVLMDETPWVSRYHELVFETLLEVVPGLTREAFEKEKLVGGVRKDVTVVQHILARMLTDPALRTAARERFWDSAVCAYYELGTPAEGIGDVLDSLSRRFRLGVIANQHPAIHGWMERHGLAPRFPVAVYDCDMGIGKPDPRIFECALDQAGCRPDRAIMVGDRLDNDIAPAKAAGMWTIRVRAFGDYRRREPTGPADTPDTTVDRVCDLPEAVEQVCMIAVERLNRLRPERL